jgi:anti-sigma B factor antagonist
MFPQAQTAFRVDSVASGPMSIIALQGEFDISVQDQLEVEIDRVLDGRPVILAIDLRGVSFMDSSGVHAMIAAGLRCERNGRRFLLIRGGPHIDRLLAACGLDGYFETVAGPDELPEGDLTI